MAQAEGSIRVLVIDDHPLVREGARVVLTAAGLDVVGEAGGAREGCALAAAFAPDVILLDLDLDGQDGLAIVPALIEAAPAARVLVFTGLRAPARHEQALFAGARGIVLKGQPNDVLVRAIRRVHAGELWFDRALLGHAIERGLRPHRADPPAVGAQAALTRRERAIVALLGEGLNNGEIARRLGISEKTVRNYLTSVFDKLGVDDRVGLLVFAYRHGLIRPEA